MTQQNVITSSAENSALSLADRLRLMASLGDCIVLPSAVAKDLANAIDAMERVKLFVAVNRKESERDLQEMRNLSAACLVATVLALTPWVGLTWRAVSGWFQ